MKVHLMIIITSISKQVVSVIVFVFVDNTDLVSGAEDVYTTAETMIEQFQ